MVPDLAARVVEEFEENQRWPKTMTVKWRFRAGGFKRSGASTPLPPEARAGAPVSQLVCPWPYTAPCCESPWKHADLHIELLGPRRPRLDLGVCVTLIFIPAMGYIKRALPCPVAFPSYSMIRVVARRHYAP